MTPDLARLAAAGVGIGAETSAEDIADILYTLQAMKDRIREVEGTVKARMLEVIEETGRPIVIGPVKYYAGVKRETKCRDVADTLGAVLEATGGDLAKLADTLCSQPVKHGAARSILAADVYDRCFVVEERAELKEGVAKKQLLSVNENFLKGGK